MAHYITNSLEEGEQIVLQGRLHWSSIFKYLLSSIFLTFVAGGFVASGYYVSKNELYYIGGVFIIIAALVYFVGCIIRTRSEFAVTTTRFIQKDGFFNIKMTEIPLFKIETVNFYQSFWQRIIGTGSIELVGSGGTSHTVNYIEKPLIVRRTIVSAINKNQNREV